MVFFAKYLIWILVFLSIGFFFTQKKGGQKKLLLLAVISLPLTFIIALLAGHIYYDPRPFVSYHFTPLVAHKANNGFPSDHALLSFVVASLLFVYNKRMGIVVGVIGLLIGIARVYVGIHSPVDILGSFVISSTVVYIVFLLLAKRKKESTSV